MSNEAFQLLSRGGVAFNKSKSDFQLFKRQKPTTPKNSVIAQPNAGELPAELDFFKSTRSSSSTGKRKAASRQQSTEEKRRRVDDMDVDEDENEDKEDAAQRLTEASVKARKTSHRVTAKGKNVPSHVNTFDELKKYSISSHLYANLVSSGYVEPTGIQSHCMPILLEERDLVAISPTGTGKTLAYLLPIFSLLSVPTSTLIASSSTSTGVRAVVVVPTRELAHQIHNECLKLAQGRKWKIVLFSKATANALSQKEARDKVDIIISTPLRLVAALQEGILDLSNVRHLVLDEADRLMDNEFMEQIQEILGSCRHKNLRKALFSATLPANAEKMAMDMLDDPIRIVVGLKDTPLPLIQQSLTYVADDSSKLPSLLTYFAQTYNPPVLVFVSTQTRATSLAEELILNNIPNIDSLHAGMTQKEREDSLSRMRKGESWVMVTTEVMARGMDFRGVREVINYDFPTTIQSYVHRIGRTGRAGREGKAVTFFTDDDAPCLKMIANVILQSGFSVPDWILKLPKPSKMKRKQMGKTKRPDSVNPARKVGRRDAIKKRDMILGSKRRTVNTTNSYAGINSD
ncbi:P-loop containing nucleoside triphosphate hydrolase protein [Crepidotus variabilis]|uniref:RNA helicase n=1 Tax=Crepidotus variabilis TaxID=179855 RepID=A0A9P6EUW2_9AGAR|nr:P-loop containing nucleoside triphosphate hydrolase protein [Crepidotus variabilis]